MYANLAIRLVVDFSRLFKSENWQRYKGALALSKDKNLIDRKNIRATLKQKAVFEWKDEFER